jgi:hypothetical protein
MLEIVLAMTSTHGNDVRWKGRGLYAWKGRDLYARKGRDLYARKGRDLYARKGRDLYARKGRDLYAWKGRELYARKGRDLYAGSVPFHASDAGLFESIILASKGYRAEEVTAPQKERRSESRGYGFVRPSWPRGAPIDPADIRIQLSGRIKANSRTMYLCETIHPCIVGLAGRYIQ